MLTQDPMPEYRLFGTIVHSGYSPESGHYYAYIKVYKYILLPCTRHVLSSLYNALILKFSPMYSRNLILYFVYRMQRADGIAVMILQSHLQPWKKFCQKRFTYFFFLALTKGQCLLGMAVPQMVQGLMALISLREARHLNVQNLMHHKKWCMQN